MRDHPFEFYKIGKVEKDGKLFCLRVKEDTLWVMDPEEPSVAECQIYKDFDIEVDNLNPGQIKEFKIKIELARELILKRKNKLNQITTPLTGICPVDFKSDQAVMILQHEYGLATASDTQTVLVTLGIEACVVFAMYDSKEKFALLAHIDATTDLDAIPKILSSFSKEHTTAHLMGGDSSSEDLCMDLVELIESQNMKLANTNLAGDSSKRSSFAIDARTGSIYAPVPDLSLPIPKDLDERWQFISSQTNKSPLKKIECKKQIKSTDQTKQYQANFGFATRPQKILETTHQPVSDVTEYLAPKA